MTKPKLPKKWKRRVLGVSTAGDELSLAHWTHNGKSSSVVLYVGKIGHAIHVSISSETTGPGIRPTQKMIRAVELAAIHAGLVEDRDR